MAAWTPDLLGSTLLAWFDGKDAASVTTVSGAVSAWANKGTGTLTLAQPNSALRPSYASNILTFTYTSSGSQGRHLLATNGLTNYDVLIVGKPFAFSGDWRTFVLSGTQNNIIVEDTSNRFGTYNSGFVQAGALTWDNVAGLAYAQVSAGNPIVLSRDGGALTSTGSSPVDTTIKGIGGAGSYDQGPIDQAFGDVYEVFYVPYNSSTAIRQQLEGYAAWKWALQSLLPGGHPYKSAAPTVPDTARASGLLVGV